MQELIDTIRAATATEATNEQKTAGVQACNTLAAALGTVPGNPLALPSTRQPSPLAGLSFEQMLDLAIAKLTSIANAQPDQAAPAFPSQAASVGRAPTRAGLQLPTPLAVPTSVIRRANVAAPANIARTKAGSTHRIQPTLNRRPR